MLPSPRRSLPAAALAMALVLMGAAQAASAAPRWVRQGFEGDPRHERLILWNDAPGVTDARVEYRRPGHAAESVPARVRDSGDGNIGAVYEATLAGLTPDTLYEYRIVARGEGTGMWSFVTAPRDRCSPFSFAVFGDNRSQTGGSAPRYGELLRSAYNQGVDFMVNTGDLVTDGEGWSQWPSYLDQANSVSALVPILAVIGNHDDGSQDGDEAPYNRLLGMPRNPQTNSEDFFFFDYGSARLIFLSTSSFTGNNWAVQTAWLEEALANNPQAFTFVFYHVPIYTCPVLGFGGHDADEAGAGTFWEPLFDRYHVDMAFQGHNHFFELFKPIRGGQAQSDPSQGTIYVTTGGAAKGDALMLIPFSGLAICPLRQETASRFHFMRVDVEGPRMELWFSDEGNQLDSSSQPPVRKLTIVKPLPDFCAAPDGDEDEDVPPLDGDIEELPGDEPAGESDEAADDPAEDDTPPDGDTTDPIDEPTEQADPADDTDAAPDAETADDPADTADDPTDALDGTDALSDVVDGAGDTTPPGPGVSNSGCRGGLPGAPAAALALLAAVAWAVRRRRTWA